MLFGSAIWALIFIKLDEPCENRVWVVAVVLGIPSIIEKQKVEEAEVANEVIVGIANSIKTVS